MTEHSKISPRQSILPPITDPTVHAEIDRLMARGAGFFGTRYAIMGGAMSWVSERHLVAALSNAGAFGVIACGAMTPELLDAEITATKSLATRNFGVNLITMHPQPLLMAFIIRHRPPQALVKGRAVIVLVQMHQFMLNQVLYPFGRQENYPPMKEEFSFVGA